MLSHLLKRMFHRFLLHSQCSHFDAFSTVCQNFKIDLEDPQLQRRYALKTYWHTVRKDHEGRFASLIL